MNSKDLDAPKDAIWKASKKAVEDTTWYGTCDAMYNEPMDSMWNIMWFSTYTMTGDFLNDI